MKAVARCLMAAPVVLSASVALADKPTLTIALDDSAQSRMLRSELARDWTQPNRALKLSRSQKKDLQARGTQFNALAAKIDGYFRIVYVDAQRVPCSVRFHLPAVRINRGAWETLDKRAFAFEGRPLVTIDWYRARHAAIARDTERPLHSDYWEYCANEGWSGGDESRAESPAPWDQANPFPTYDELEIP